MRGRVNGSNFMPDVSSPTWLHLRADHKRVNTNTRTASWRSEEDEASSRRFSIDHAIRIRRGCVIQARITISRESDVDPSVKSLTLRSGASGVSLVCHVKKPFFFRNVGTLPGTSLTGSPALELTRHTNPQRLNTYAAFHFHEHMTENLSTYSRVLAAHSWNLGSRPS